MVKNIAGNNKPQAKDLVLAKGDCQSSFSKHNDASVKSLEFFSEICLSEERLRKIPKDSLEDELTALLAHEYMHTFGYLEKESDLIQQFIIQNIETSHGVVHRWRRWI